MLKSGVHATLAGVVLALFIPLRIPGAPDRSPLRDFEHDLHTSVVFGILPLFAFANSGVSLSNLDMEQMLHPVSSGIAAGLFIGKQAGITVCCWAGDIAPDRPLTVFLDDIGCNPQHVSAGVHHLKQRAGRATSLNTSSTSGAS